MNSMEYKDDYLAADPDFLTLVESLINEGKHGKVHFISPSRTIEDASGKIAGMVKTRGGEFIQVGDEKIRIDKIITLFGKPGPWYEEYERYANACLTCEDLDQF